MKSPREKIQEELEGLKYLIKEFKKCLNLSSCTKRGCNKNLVRLNQIGKMYLSEIEKQLVEETKQIS